MLVLVTQNIFVLQWKKKNFFLDKVKAKSGLEYFLRQNEYRIPLFLL